MHHHQSSCPGEAINKIPAEGGGARAFTRTRVRIELAVMKICLAGEASTAFLFRTSILPSNSDTWISRVCVSITAGLA
jgi:hypothetical protein